MKRIALVATLLLVAVSSFAQSGKSIYRKYSDMEDVTSVYISPFMFRMMGRLDVNMGGGDVDIAPFVRSLRGMYVINCDDKRLSDKLMTDVNRFIDSGEYEILIEANDGDDKVKMYAVIDRDVATSLVILTIDDWDTTFVCFDGEIPLEDLERIVEDQIN